MKVLVLGTGLMGSVLVSDLVESSDVSDVVVGDIDEGRLKLLAEHINNDKVSTQQVDVKDQKSLINVMKNVDIVASALPMWAHNVEIAKTAIKQGINFVDLGSLDSIFKLDKAAKDANVNIISSCGFHPGIESILVGYGSKKLDKVEKLNIWGGGIPQKNTPAYNNPIKYKINWHWQFAMPKPERANVKIIKEGKFIEVNKFDPKNLETITFPEPIGECEAYFSSTPFDEINNIGLKDIKEAWYKTLRWPGTTEMWNKLIDLELLSTDLNLKIKGVNITPREFLIELGNKTLQYEKGEGDLAIQRTNVLGEKNGEKAMFTAELIDFYDEEKGETAMARTVSFPCSIVAQMIGRGNIKEKGVIHSAQIGLNTQIAEEFIAELIKRNIQIKYSIQSI